MNFVVGDAVNAYTVNNNDIAFHFNPRLDDKIVVRNSRTSNGWEEEERRPYHMPFAAGGGFELMFLVHPEHFKVAGVSLFYESCLHDMLITLVIIVNGAHLLEFKHRMPIHLVKILNITGDVMIDKIEYRSEFKYPGEIGFKSTYGVPGLPSPVYNPPIPMIHPLMGGLTTNRLIHISGKPSLLYNQFDINFLKTNGGSPSSGETEIAFHFNPRRMERIVVRNTRDKHSGWGREERSQSEYPFTAGVNFEILIRVGINCFQVAVNNEHFCEYQHRLLPLNKIDFLQITGDVIIASVRFA